MNKTFQFGFVFLLFWCCINPTMGQDESAKKENTRLGIVKDKPASGPFVKVDEGYMVPFQDTIYGTEEKIEMIPIAGGTFKMGSPDDEEGREDDEGPQIEITVEPFWIGKYEVTWRQYKPFMALHDIFKDFQTYKMREVTDTENIEVISAPSNLYEPTFTYKAGDGPNEPAATMTQHSAKQYTKWLSIMQKDFYRIPSEAEWEYACRAGTTTAYFFGDDPSKLGDYAWFKENSDKKRHPVGEKKPNPWGLYDVHGNVSEWVLDGYSDEGYSEWEGKKLSGDKAIAWPEEVYPLVVRGGSYTLKAKACRSSSRLATEDEDWKSEDPNYPQSPYWFTTRPATGVGMRIVRPYKVPERKVQEKFWKPFHEDITDVVKQRVEQEGRGAFGIVDRKLPEAIKQLKEVKSKN